MLDLKASIFLYISFLWISSLLSQESSTIYFNHLTTKDGLSHNTVNRIEQDKLGFIWFGTFDGLCRYDGKSIVTYKYQSSDST